MAGMPLWGLPIDSAVPTLCRVKSSAKGNMHATSYPKENESVSAFANSAKDLLQALSPISRLREYRTNSPRFDQSIWKQLAEAGWTSILASEELGGLGLDLRHACAVAEQIGRHLLPEPFLGGAVLSISLLERLPRGLLRDELLSAAVSGDSLIGTAWQERAGQLDPEESLSVTASLHDVTYTLTGSKAWVVPGIGAQGWLVSAVQGGKPGIWWVPASAAGVVASDEQRIDNSSCASLALNQVLLPAHHCLVIGDDAMIALRRALDTTRFAQAAELLGIARQTLEMTLDYLRTRTQFGKPIGANQALQHRIVDAYIQVELAAATLDESLTEIEESEVHLLAGASRTKARCAHAALHVTRLGLQFHGAIGYTDEYDLGLYLKRTLQHVGWLGSEAAMRLRYHNDVRTSAPGSEAGLDADSGSVPTHSDWAKMTEQEFRQVVRAFIRNNYPEHLRHPAHRLHWNECRDWYMTLSRQGWLAPAWPQEHGGMGLPGDKYLAYIEEMEDYGVARLPDQGIINLGPILIRYGNVAQQKAYLPKILSGENIWCQGYSEPNAGSDLASLRTEAILDGNEFVVTGQKIWTTLAQDATHIFALVRTDKGPKKQDGISFLLIDLTSAGISIRPIRNIGGEEEFCEVFFDKVRVPRANLVGEMNAGWGIAKTLLGFERLFVGSPKTAQYAINLLRRVAEVRGLFDEPAFVARFAQLELDVADLKATYSQFAEIIKRGGELPPSVSILKIWASETYTAITRFLHESCEEFGGQLGEIKLEGAEVNIVAPMLNATITTIYAGSNEIQRNILAKAVLKLPS